MFCKKRIVSVFMTVFHVSAKLKFKQFSNSTASLQAV